MAIVSGPLHSDTASGTVAGSTVFANRRGRNIARAHVRPRDANSDKQWAVRRLTAYLVTVWHSLEAAQRAVWAATPTGQKISGYHAFLIAARAQWNAALTIISHPGKIYPGDQLSPPIAEAIPEGDGTNLAVAANDFLTAAVAVFYVPAGQDTPTAANLFAIIPANEDQTVRAFIPRKPPENATLTPCAIDLAGHRSDFV